MRFFLIYHLGLFQKKPATLLVTGYNFVGVSCPNIKLQDKNILFSVFVYFYTSVFQVISTTLQLALSFQLSLFPSLISFDQASILNELFIHLEFRTYRSTFQLTSRPFLKLNHFCLNSPFVNTLLLSYPQELDFYILRFFLKFFLP